jgi:para-aminobenzoate synthetase/4-amino-4-deoxychorismate lyase
MPAPSVSLSFPQPPHEPPQSLWFGRFEHVFEASSLADVMPCLEEVDAAVASGLHAVGYIAYEAAPAFDPALAVHPPDTRLPLLWFGVGPAPVPEPASAGCTEDWWLGPWRAAWDADDYQAAFDRAQSQIRDGATYQVNLSFPMQAAFVGSVRACYQELIAAQPGYGAWLHLDGVDILSSSPELFFEVAGRRITARPMKGTRPRGADALADQALAAELASSPKERAENVMIVDLLRNDLGRVAVPGSVTVPTLFAVESYPTVLQMTSTVTAELPPAAGMVQLMSALFPCGSVTGAPKVKTMEIIRELEPHPRGAYCGAIGYVSPGGRAVFNVAIRTLSVFAGSQAEYRVGSGLVAGASCAAELEECRIKARVLTAAAAAAPMQLLESLRHTPTEGYYLLARHLDRLQAAAARFGYPFDRAVVSAALADAAAWQTPQKVRLLLAEDGAITIDAAPLTPPEFVLPRTVALAPTPVPRGLPFLRYKTTCRSVYDAARAAVQDADDVLLWNEEGQVTEGSSANVAAQIDGRWLTPPTDCGLLPGTMRAELLAAGEIEEGVISCEALAAASAVRLFNSVRGVWDVEVIRARQADPQSTP